MTRRRRQSMWLLSACVLCSCATTTDPRTVSVDEDGGTQVDLARAKRDSAPPVTNELDGAPPMADTREAPADDGGHDLATAAHDAGRDSTVVTDTRPSPSAAMGPAGAACPPGAFGSPLAQGRTATRIREGFDFIEGPVWIVAEKALFFSDFRLSSTQGRIQKYTPADGRFTVLATGATNGLAADGQGQILAAAFDERRVVRIDPTSGMRSAIAGAGAYQGRPFNSLNDLVARADGNVYFTDPNYQQMGRPGQGPTAYYRLSPAGVVTRIGQVSQPNGINLSPDGRWLYVASTGGAPVRRHPVNADGSVGDGSTFVDTSSDGMAVDCAGNLYLTAGGVRVVSPGGQTIGTIGGVEGATNMAFGGDDGRTLFITSRSGLYQIRLGVPGLPN